MFKFYVAKLFLCSAVIKLWAGGNVITENETVMQSIAGKNNTITVISLFGFGKQHKWNVIIYWNSF